MAAPRTRLTALELINFRSHPRARLECSAPVVVLHGANGSGKTSLLEAISMFAPGRSLRGATVDDAARQANPTGWHVRADVASHDEVHRIESHLSLTPARRRTTTIDDAPATRVELAQLFRVSWLTPSMDRTWNGPAADRRRLLDRLTATFIPAHATATATYEKAMRERNRLLRDRVPDDIWLGELEERMATAGAAIATNRSRSLREIAAVFTSEFSQFPRAKFAIIRVENRAVSSAPATEASAGVSEGWSAPELQEALRHGRYRDGAAGRTLSGPHRDDLGAWLLADGMPLRNASTGEQKGVLIGFVLASVRALVHAGFPAVLLLDEIAAHLDQNRRESLLREIADLGAQAWLTGTEPTLFESVRNAEWFELTKVNDVSDVRRVDSQIRQESGDGEEESHSG